MADQVASFAKECALTWFNDLTPYSYVDGQDTKPPTLNIGWLEHGHEFATGDVPASFIERLEVLHAHGWTQATRGRHYCDLCPSQDDDDDEGAWGHAELRAVAADGTRFAAPMLVLHYVTAHRYAPPQSFIDAVLRVSLEWERAEAQDLCVSCGGGMQRIATYDGLVRGSTREPVISVHLRCETCGTVYLRSFPDRARG